MHTLFDPSSGAAHNGFTRLLHCVASNQVCDVLALTIRKTRVERLMETPMFVNGAERVRRKSVGRLLVRAGCLIRAIFACFEDFIAAESSD